MLCSLEKKNITDTRRATEVDKCTTIYRFVSFKLQQHCKTGWTGCRVCSTSILYNFCKHPLIPGYPTKMFTLFANGLQKQVQKQKKDQSENPIGVFHVQISEKCLHFSAKYVMPNPHITVGCSAYEQNALCQLGDTMQHPWRKSGGYSLVSLPNLYIQNAYTMVSTPDHHSRPRAFFSC